MNDPTAIKMPGGVVLYHCNPDLATDCKKTHCFLFGGRCSKTPRKEWACVTVGDLIRRKDNSQLAEYLAGICACPPVNCDALNVTCRTCWYRFLSSPAADGMDL